MYVFRNVFAFVDYVVTLLVIVKVNLYIVFFPSIITVYGIYTALLDMFMVSCYTLQIVTTGFVFM